MHKRKIRNEKTCLNCGHEVEERFCPACGQENVEHRQSFPELTAHFAEDLTHYDGKFWASLKLLFFRPGRLTRQYLSGRINSYLPPVRMYIFVSFVTFLFPHLLPEVPDEFAESVRSAQQKELVIDTGIVGKTYSFAYIMDSGLVLESPYKTLYKLDSARNMMAATDTPLRWDVYHMYKKSIELQKYTSIEKWDKFTASLGRNFPKTLFLYMPLFALIIRLFHSKKNWIYFDHAIFTLHYFSFVLLAFTALVFISWMLDWLGHWLDAEGFAQEIFGLLFMGLIVWYIIYFFRAHRVVYHESWGISTLKATGIYVVNLALFIVLFITLVVLSIWMLH